MSEPTNPFWEDEPEVWDRVILGPFILPGVVDVHEPMLEEVVDVKKPTGGSGAVVTFLGPAPVSFDIVMTLYNAAHWEDFKIIAPQLRPLAGKGARKAYGIIHPKINVWGVTSVLLVKMKGPQQGSVKGTYQVTLSCLEFTALPKTSIVTPKKADPVGNLYFNSTNGRVPSAATTAGSDAGAAIAPSADPGQSAP